MELGVIITDELTKKFGKFTAVKNLSFTVNEGDIFGFLGPNGAGKTTTVRMLSCVLKPTSGSAQVGGYDIQKNALKVKRIVGLLPEEPGLYEYLSAYRNLEFFAKIHQMSKYERRKKIRRILELVGLDGHANEKVGKFSHGMKKKLAIARALVHDPEILFLDEPTAEVDPISRRAIRNFIKELAEEKRTIFLTTHDMSEVEKLCSRIAFIRDGELVAIGAMEELKKDICAERRMLVRLKKADQNIINALRREDFIQDVYIKGDTLHIVVGNMTVEQASPKLIEAVSKANGVILEIMEEELLLEDAFEYYTKRRETDEV